MKPIHILQHTSKMQPNNLKYYLLFFISILSILEPVISLLQISTLSISTSATYTIQLSQYLTTAPIGTIIQLELPYQYNSDDLHAGIPYTGSPLTDGFCPVDCASVTVSYSGFIFNITGMFTTAEPLGFRYSILAVLNPRVAVTVSGYIIRAIDTGGNTIYSENAAGRTFLPRTITCTGVATDYTQIGFISTSSLTINPISNPKDQPLTYIQIQFSSNWLSDPISASSLPNDIYCLSSSQPSIICQRNSQILSISGVTFSSTIDIEIHSIQNPSLVFSAGSVTVTTLTSNRYKLDTCTLSLSGFTQDYLRSPTLQITYDSDTQISVLVSVIFPARGFASGTNVLFTFPSALPIAGAVCKIYLGSFLLSSVLPTFIPATNSISASPFSSLTFKPNLQLECTGIVRPRAATLMPNITISSSYNGNLIGSIQCCSTVLEPRSTLNVVSILTDKPYLGAANAQYVFKIITSVSLLTTDLIYIYFPKQYQLGVGTLPCTVSSPTAVVSSPTCSLSAGNLIRISSFLSSATSACQLTLTISSISNPSSNPSTTPFQIQLLNSAQQILELNPSQVVTISASIITIFTVNTVTKVTLQKPVQYVVQFVTNGLLQINYYVLIGLPADIGVYEAGLACSIGGKAVGCWWDGAAVVLRVVEAAATNTVNVVVDGIWNPQSMAPTQNFYLRILDPNSNIIQISNPTLNTSVSMTSPTTFKLAISSILGTTLPSSNLYETSMLQIILVTGITLKSTHKLSISYNSAEIIFTASSACSTGYTCNFDTANSIVNVVAITSAVGFDTLFFNVSNVRGIVTVPTFTFTLKDSLDFSIMQSTTTAQRFSPDLLSYTLTQSSLLYSGTSDITLAYTLASLSTSGVTAVQSKVSYILVQIPKQYTSSYTNNIYNYTDLNGTINILSVTNPGPSYESSGYFYLTGFASTGQILAVSISNAKFVLACTMPCRTCSGSVTNCSTCYSWSNYNLFISVANSGSCVTHCPRFYYQDTNTSTCKSCDTNCYQCDQTSGVKCLSCPTSNYLHELDYKCYADCPPGFYQYGLINGAVCRSCPINCLTCLNESYCLSCATGLYIYLNKCITNCPPSTYSLTTPSLSCFACFITNCMQCTQTTCLACTPPYYLSSNQCLSTCPFPLYPTITGICKACQCLTCSNYASNCTSCNSLKPYLYNNYCYVACPSGMYPGSLNICTACNLNCITCTSDTLCTLCKQGYAILTYSYINVGCVGTTLCPSNTILTTSTPGVPTCLSCTSPCSTCQISVNFCLTCIANYNFHNNSCVLNCPYPYHSINNYCKKCIAVCQICEPTDPYNCTQCNANYFILNNSCYSTCPSGTYTDLLSKSCLTCSSVCKTCANATNCTSCITNFFLFNWFCYSTCPTVPILYYQYNGVCTACQPQCLSCSGSPVACTACSHPDYLYNVVTKQCVFQCTGVYFKSGSNCIACQSPCATCDTTYNSCSSCINSLFLYNGTCVTQCPLGYFGNTTTLICSRCAFPCKICMQTQCLLCESFAYMYQKSCVLSCPDDMPYQQPGYCSDCIGIGFCARCSKSTTTGSQICSKCVYPYVLFQENCLNECPTNYTATEVDSARVCEKSSSYLEYLSAKQKFNQPIIPPFLTLGLYLLISCILLVLSHRVYRFTYHVGFMLGFIPAFDSLFTYYCIYYIYTRYEGEYIPLVPILPLAFLCSALVYNNIIMTILYWILVLRGVYLPDIRYKQWKQKINCYWWVLTILMPFLGGHRLHKINYSKIFGIERFSFRIVSVQKFYQEDIITYCTSLGDIIQIAAVTVGIYNVFISYHGILLIGYECIAIKIIEWLLTLYDLKKPDRGFFIGDQQEAEQQINKELEQEQRKLNRVDTQHFAKLVRTKSAELIRNPKYFGNIDIDDFISVYNPDDYEEVIKVPNKKIQKNIYRGKYRRGRKITIEQKLQKFVDTIKPKPKIDGKRVNSYLHKLIYWKPPQMKTKAPTKVLPQSEQSMLALLQKKQQEYKEDLDDIVMVDDEKQGRYYARPRYDQRTFLDDLDETIPNQTVQFFYPSHSIENTAQKQNSLDFDDLMNLNYAKKKHLYKQEPNEFESKRKLHNQPQKKRRNLKGFGQMVLKNDY